MMPILELSPDDAAVLAEVLETDLSDLRMEIAHTDRQEFRERLKARKAVLEAALRALRS